MEFNTHHNMKGKHAVFSPSKPSWLKYSVEQARSYVYKSNASERGTEIHELAEKLIKLGIRQRKCNDYFCMYVNDALSFRMKPEILLYYHDRCFGTADTIVYDEMNNILRIHDLKTGTGTVHVDQLLTYAALFCLEYHKNPEQMQFELRIYQNNPNGEPCPYSFVPSPEEVRKAMDQIVLVCRETDDIPNY